MGHVDEVQVSRCGDWFLGLCPGDEHGCRRCHDPTVHVMGGYKTLIDFDLDHLDLTLEEEDVWRKMPHPATLSHRQFLLEYDRCPDTCCVAEQIGVFDER